MEAENEQCDKGAIKHRRHASPQVVECKKVWRVPCHCRRQWPVKRNKITTPSPKLGMLVPKRHRAANALNTVRQSRQVAVEVAF